MPVTEEQQAALSRLRGQAAAQLPNSALQRDFIARQGGMTQSAGPSEVVPHFNTVTPVGGPNVKPMDLMDYLMLQKQAENSLATNGQSEMTRPTGFGAIGR